MQPAVLVGVLQCRPPSSPWLIWASLGLLLIVVHTAVGQSTQAATMPVTSTVGNTQTGLSAATSSTQHTPSSQPDQTPGTTTRPPTTLPWHTMTTQHAATTTPPVTTRGTTIFPGAGWDRTSKLAPSRSETMTTRSPTTTPRPSSAASASPIVPSVSTTTPSQTPKVVSTTSTRIPQTPTDPTSSTRITQTPTNHTSSGSTRMTQSITSTMPSSPSAAASEHGTTRQRPTVPHISASGSGPIVHRSATPSTPTTTGVAMTAANNTAALTALVTAGITVRGSSVDSQLDNSTDTPPIFLDDSSTATSAGFIALYVFCGLLVVTFLISCCCKYKLIREQVHKPLDQEIGLLYASELSPGQKLQEKWNGNPVFGAAQSNNMIIEELNMSDDSDHDTSLAETMKVADTQSVATDVTGTDSRSATLPRSLKGGMVGTTLPRPPGTLEFSGASTASTPAGTWHREHSRRSDDEGREGGDEEEFSGREDTSIFRRSFFNRAATLDSLSRRQESRSFKRKRFAGMKSKSAATSPMQEMTEEGRTPPPLPGENRMLALDDVRRSTRKRGATLSSLPQAVAPALPLGAPPPPPPIPKGGFQPTSPLASPTPLLSASSTDSLDTVLSDHTPTPPGTGSALASGGDEAPAKTPITELDDMPEEEPDHYALVGQLDMDGGAPPGEESNYLRPADDSVIRYSLIKAKTSAASQQSVESPDSMRRSARRSSKRHVRKMPTVQKSSACSLKRQSAAEQWKVDENSVSTLPRLPYYRGHDDSSHDDQATVTVASKSSTAPGKLSAHILKGFEPALDSVSQSALSRLEESDAEHTTHAASSLVVLAGANADSREQLLEMSSPEEAPSQNTLTDDTTTRNTPRRVLSQLDAILRAEGGASSVPDLQHNGSSSYFLSSTDTTLERKPGLNTIAQNSAPKMPAAVENASHGVMVKQPLPPQPEIVMEQPATLDESQFKRGVTTQSTPVSHAAALVRKPTVTKQRSDAFYRTERVEYDRIRSTMQPASQSATRVRTFECEDYYLQHTAHLGNAGVPAFY
ncbi:mucin-2-like isoform X2 [Sycon ciliatum]|uniref:mucin-2-like isoform X2 n=1 Tax=Sycon ciliatum TaxID=27933 RepID=UPI0031F710B8